MYITNVTDYDNMTDDYNDTLSPNNNCTLNEMSIDTIISCGLSFFCLISLMVYTINKTLKNRKY